MSEMVERVARAIEAAEIGYTLGLTSLVDGVSTYTLTYSDGSPKLEFPDTDEAYAHIASKRTEARARAAIEAMREPTDLMGNGLPPDYRAGSLSASQIWQLMIDAALKPTGEQG